ncbi:major facilitator transporter [Brachybacterium phenoliresistens]|uniref:Major facilitator transporter n=2 Tax=Brachybacterium phenoliresistens TaxID=396014 RepID=Z9JPH7_9MICO|nr:sugar porter family MFS transporter [Brachybacterium phenoliresistens]EWS80315.1 major facilitator transporter [Brachybacterium phenoliresistens]
MSDHEPRSAETQLPPLGTGPFRARLGQISVIACFGGLLFGYDTGVANGAEGPMAQELGLSLIQLGIVISSLVFAAAVGALIGGKVSDIIGRRRSIIIMSVLFFTGTLLVVLSPGGPELGTHSDVGYGTLVAGRIMLGLAVGAASTVVPVYLAELAPYEIRGSITGRNELAIVSGQLAAFVMNYVIAATLGDHIVGIWRVMFAMCALPAIALFIGMLRMPESPRWLVEKRRHDEALAVLMTVRSEERARAELGEVEQVAEEEAAEAKVGLPGLLSNKFLIGIVLIGIGVSMTQQLTGINSIMYYGTRVLKESGMTESQATLANIAFGVVAVIGGIIALRNMDRLDRRVTFLIGLSLTTTFHCLVGIASVVLPEGAALRPIVILVLVVGFVFSMQTFLNVAVWVWLAEIFPLHMRGLGIGISVFFGWFTNGLLALFFPTLVENIGITGSFFIFAAIGVVALTFVWRFVPETRGVSLEKLEEDVTTGEIHILTRKKRIVTAIVKKP